MLRGAPRDPTSEPRERAPGAVGVSALDPLRASAQVDGAAGAGKSPAPPVPGAYLSPALPSTDSGARGGAAIPAPPMSIEAWNALTQRPGSKEPLDSLSPIPSFAGSPANPQLPGVFSPVSSHATMYTAPEVFSERSSEGYNTPQTVQSAVWRFVQSPADLPQEKVQDTAGGRETHTVVHHGGFVLPPMKLNDFTRHLERSESQRSSSSDGRSSWLARARKASSGRAPLRSPS